jgi:hypothetical protein
MKGHSGAVKQTLFAITETVLRLVKVPCVTSVLLLTRSEVPMSLEVHLADILIILDLSLGLQGVFNSDLTRCQTWDTKLELACLGCLRPVITSNVALR